MTMLYLNWGDPSSSGVVVADNFADRISDDDALLDLEEDHSRRKPKNSNFYIWLMARYPIVIAVISLILGCLSFITLYKHPLPDFEDPTAGFEARGTSISGAHRTLKLMKKHASFSPDEDLAKKMLNISKEDLQMLDHFMHPFDQSSPRQHDKRPVEVTTYKPKQKSKENSPVSEVTSTTVSLTQKPKPTKSQGHPKSSATTTSSSLSTWPADPVTRSKSTAESSSKNGRSSKTFANIRGLLKGFFNVSDTDDFKHKLKDATNGIVHMNRREKRSSSCLKIERGSVKVVFEEVRGGNLWTPEAMHAICDMQDRLITPSLRSNLTCTFVSLPNLIAKQQGKKCHELNATDLLEVGKFIRQCSSYACLHGCPNPDKQCLKYHGDSLTMAYYLMDKDFFSGNITDFKLKYTMLFYSQEAYRFLPDFGYYYEHTFAHASLRNDYVKIAGIYTDVDDKFDLFNTYMMEDLKFFVLAGVLVLVILTVYLGSVALIIATLINVFLSLGVAYFFYKVVLRIAFFPFMNVLAGIILIAVGADDVFIYYDTYQMVKKKNIDNASQEKIVARTFRHAAVSIFVTSLTTSGAFFANSISRIAAIRCFGVFAGLAILANFFFMVTWTPSTIVLVDQIWTLWNKHNSKITSALFKGCSEVCQTALAYIRSGCAKVAHAVFAKAFPFSAKRLWLPCIVILTAVGICGFVVVFVKPRLKLPDSKEFPLFPESHPMEYYDQNLRDKFRWQLEEAKEQEMTVYFLWGAFNQDNGNHLDPDDDGHLEVDPDFDLTAPESQVWMKSFCNKLKVANFSDTSMQGASCLLDTIQQKQQHICSGIRPFMGMLTHTNVPLCCNASSLPYSAEAFKLCFPLLLHYVPDPLSSLGSVLFDDQNNITGVMVGIRTKQNPTTSYVKMNKLVSDMDAFLANELATAPVGLKNGWYMGTTESFVFYDLQNAISHGTYSSIELSLAVACITMFLCTLNAFITIYSMITISFAIAVTIGSLVLLGWQLNIVESVTISLAVGLSIDFTIHFGVAYVLAPASKAKDRVEDAFIRVGPAVAMAALTTFIAGAAVMPSRIRAYQELGLFLMLVMATSWVYSNFFFQSVCAVIGPRGNFCQIPLPWKGCKNQQHYENPAAAEQLDIHSLSSVDSDDDDDIALILNG